MNRLEHGSPQAQTYVTVLLRGFQARGQLAILGMLQTFLNDEQKDAFSLHGVMLYGLEPGNPARSMQLNGLFVHKNACQMIAFDTMLPHEQTGLLPRTERLAVYTSHYCIQGDFHMGADALLAEFIAGSRAQFVGASNVQVFPLFHPQAEMIQAAPLAFLHRSAVLMHHLV
ncbi:MAG: hypothetical protein OZ934_09855 [Anaerolineae bacterium]|nr:hypothetical protein [Anaerolineae bacterium]